MTQVNALVVTICHFATSGQEIKVVAKIAWVEDCSSNNLNNGKIK
jgi:hypothetical protein